MSSKGGRFVTSIALVVLAVIASWQANEVLVRAQKIAASTFQFQPAKFALADLLVALAGVSIGLLILVNGGRLRDGWPALTAAVIPLAMVATVLLYLNEVDVGFSAVGQDWLFSSISQTVASFMVGLLILLGLTATRDDRSP